MRSERNKGRTFFCYQKEKSFYKIRASKNYSGVCFLFGLQVCFKVRKKRERAILKVFLFLLLTTVTSYNPAWFWVTMAKSKSKPILFTRIRWHNSVDSPMSFDVTGAIHVCFHLKTNSSFRRKCKDFKHSSTKWALLRKKNRSYCSAFCVFVNIVW